MTPEGAGPADPADPTQAGAVEARAVQRDVDRLAAFSDGVFAIAITLLVVTIGVPNLANKRLDGVMHDVYRQLFTYALSFLVIGLYWKVHHRMFRTLRRVDNALLNINLLLLGFVALIPFPTAVLGKFGDDYEAVIMYASAIAATGFSSAYLWYHLEKAELITPSPPDVVRARRIRSLVAPVVFVASIPIALVSVPAAELSWILIFVVNLLVTWRYGADPDEAPGRATMGA